MSYECDPNHATASNEAKLLPCDCISFGMPWLSMNFNWTHFDECTLFGDAVSMLSLLLLLLLLEMCSIELFDEHCGVFASVYC